MCQYRYIQFRCTCDGQVWFKACASPISVPELNTGYLLCRQKSFQSPYTVTFSAICCRCHALRLQAGGYSLDAHVIISEFNEGIREVLGKSTNEELWIQLHSLAGTQWEYLVLRSVESVENGLEGLRNLSLGEKVIKTKDRVRSATQRNKSSIGTAVQGSREGEDGGNNAGCGDGMTSVNGSDKTVEEISRSLYLMYV